MTNPAPQKKRQKTLAISLDHASVAIFKEIQSRTAERRLRTSLRKALLAGLRALKASSATEVNQLLEEVEALDGRRTRHHKPGRSADSEDGTELTLFTMVFPAQPNND